MRTELGEKGLIGRRAVADRDGDLIVGAEDGRLVFTRFREVLPEDQLSPARSHTMRLDPHWVTSISVDGRPVWPRDD